MKATDQQRGDGQAKKENDLQYDYRAKVTDQQHDEGQARMEASASLAARLAGRGSRARSLRRSSTSERSSTTAGRSEEYAVRLAIHRHALNVIPRFVVRRRVLLLVTPALSRGERCLHSLVRQTTDAGK